MPSPRNALEAFLKYAKRTLVDALNGHHKVTVVIGNESADLDSFTSSVLFAYVRSIALPGNGFSPVYVPCLNIPSAGIRLRPEISALCDHAGISTSSLLTLDDLPYEKIRPENVRWVLVDHNRMQGELGERFSAQVIGVIDHHEEEHAVPVNTEPEPRVVDKAGSCTSLVVRYCRSDWEVISSMSQSEGAARARSESAEHDGVYSHAWDVRMAKIGLASILIDTANLNAPGKVQAVDREAVEYLEAKIQKSPRDASTWNRESFFNGIQQAKMNIDGLTLDEILIKDYKQWMENSKTLGISSVVKPLQYLVAKGEESFEKTLEDFMESKGLSVFAIMTTYTSYTDDFQRQLLLQSREANHTAVEKFVAIAKAELGLDEGLDLGLTKQTESSASGIWRNFWWQKDISKSRKQVGPLLRWALQE
ncbi:MAG: hypothetical protein Q9163_001160 [Psora crenata]